MNSFFDLSDREVLALDQATIERYIDYECAMEGIALLPPKPEPLPANPPEHAPNVTVYMIAGISTTDQQQANDLMAYLCQMTLVEISRPSYSYREEFVVPLENMPQMTTKKAFTQESWEAIKDDVTKYNDLKEEYNYLQKEYDRANAGRKDIVKKVQEHITLIKKKQGRKDYLRSEWGRYKDLAEGNVEIAYSFIIKVLPEVREHDDLMEEFEIDKFLNV